ncbi:plantacyanin [Perilla frutescens var. frutescens]|nr:plantacyanin [Perilla frutescens var. frutescens]
MWSAGRKARPSRPETPSCSYNSAIHNVVVVDKGGYKGCVTTPSGAKVFQTGKDQIKLKKGSNFFICTIPGHCQSGMKIAVTAL